MCVYVCTGVRVYSSMRLLKSTPTYTHEMNLNSQLYKFNSFPVSIHAAACMWHVVAINIMVGHGHSSYNVYGLFGDDFNLAV